MNLFDYCLINVLKLIRNTLDPQGNIKNFVKFNANLPLKTSILKLMQRNVVDMEQGEENYTFNRFQINFFFLGVLVNIYERNGFTFHSFGDKNLANLYEIEHILTHLDTRILRYFIEFIQSSRLKKQEIKLIDDKQELLSDALEKLEEENSEKNISLETSNR